MMREMFPFGGDSRTMCGHVSAMLQSTNTQVIWSVGRLSRDRLVSCICIVTAKVIRRTVPGAPIFGIVWSVGQDEKIRQDVWRCERIRQDI